MIIGIGCDVIEISRIEKAAAKDNFCTKIFTIQEQEYIHTKQDARAVASLAAFFAAKEAIAKALGVGIGKIGWQEIDITHDAWGKPFVQLSGRALALAQDMGVEKIHLSLSHSKECAMAMAVLEG